VSPVEQEAYLLREVFAYEYSQIADVIERSEANSRQLVTRARKHLEASRPRFDPDEAVRDALLERFLAAVEDGDVGALEELLARDVVLYADGGGKVIAPPEPLVGAALVARFMITVNQVRRAFGHFAPQRVRVNGQPGRLLRGPRDRPYGDAERLAAGHALGRLRAGEIEPKEAAAFMMAALDLPVRGDQGVAEDDGDVGVREVLTVDVADGRIQAVRIVRNPDKLERLYLGARVTLEVR